MTAAASPRHPHAWRCAMLVVLTALAVPATAQSLHCGTFKDEDSGTVLRVVSAVDAERQRPGQAPEPYHLVWTDDTLTAVNLAREASSVLSISADGRYLNDDTDHYARDSDVACQVAPPFADGSCRQDIAACMRTMVWAGADSWRRWCGEGIEVACNRLIEDYRSDARNDWVIAKVMADPTVPASVPSVCQEDSPAFDAAECRSADDKQRIGDVGKAFSLVKEMPAALPLPAERLDELATLCSQHPTAGFCTAVSAALRVAGQLPAAHRALQLACNPGNGPQACAQLADEAAAQPAAASPTHGAH
ncbi:hypothetical protein [Stenotrophomonas sp.]|uniref:hypothetical protein n=1 Tax=Stenotrophomonas sp. TaxID=69392 RepID=UPI002899F4F1|nr:hypothetical protein [Stenotrophomonas sp.]